MATSSTVPDPNPSAAPGTLPAWCLSWQICVAFLAVYLSVCSFLRFRFEEAMLRKFNYLDRNSMSRMTNDDAQAIMKYIMDQEFPQFYQLALQFAIFKVRMLLELFLSAR